MSTRRASGYQIHVSNKPTPGDSLTISDKRVFRAWRVATKIGRTAKNFMALCIEMTFIEDSLFNPRPQHAPASTKRCYFVENQEIGHKIVYNGGE
jgi:hypothetical protein